jgi:hypothetical protein
MEYCHIRLVSKGANERRRAKDSSIAGVEGCMNPHAEPDEDFSESSVVALLAIA